MAPPQSLLYVVPLVQHDVELLGDDGNFLGAELSRLHAVVATHSRSRGSCDRANGPFDAPDQERRRGKGRCQRDPDGGNSQMGVLAGVDYNRLRGNYRNRSPIRSRHRCYTGDVFRPVTAPIAKRCARIGFPVECGRQQLRVGDLLAEPILGIGTAGASSCTFPRNQ